MPTKVERYQQLYGRRRDDLLSEVLPAGAAYDRARQSGELAATDLAAIVDAAAHPRLLVAMNASELLQALSARWPAATSQAILDLMASAKAHARFAALCAATTHTESEVLRKVLQRGLMDKSARVRWKAADRAERLERRDLLPDIERAIAAETNAKTRQTLQHHLRMLRDGYIAEDRPGGRVSVWLRTSRGASGHDVDAATVKEKGIAAVVAELRKAE